MAKTPFPMWADPLRPYFDLLGAFIGGTVQGDEFETRFLTLYKNDPAHRPEEIFDVLDGFFADVDDFVADPDLRARAGGLDEDQLRERAILTVSRLTELVGPL